MTTTIITPEIASFAEAVRDALHDLPHEERDELTEGLEADLAEAYAEDLVREFPDPAEYATELRNAAGLPKLESSSAGMVASLVVAVRRMRGDLAEGVRRNPVLAPAGEFLVAIRPVWWLARAGVAAWLVAAILGLGAGYPFTSGMAWAVFMVLLVVSVQWGRGQWAAHRIAPVIVLGNVVAVIMAAAIVLLPVSALTSNDYGAGYYDGVAAAYSEPQDLTGVYLDGVAVTNIFPYDSSGKPIDDVQLFDQDGRPLATSVDGGNGCLDESCDTLGLWSPRSLESGIAAFNVFPLSMIAGSYVDGVLVADQDATPQQRKAPIPKVPALLASDN